ncbi:MAG TPA: hypothetical protein VFU35_01895 [Jatrophihabitans sp.]|nr:hypothetical protein [Jatrophihabitans sp.]
MPIADLIPHRPNIGSARRAVRVDDIEAGLRDLPDWGSAAFAHELGVLDEAVDDETTDPWLRRA